MYFKHTLISAIVGLMAAGSLYAMQDPQQGTIHTLPTIHSNQISSNQLELMQDVTSSKIKKYSNERNLHLLGGAVFLGGSLIAARYEYPTFNSVFGSASGINLALALRAHLKLRKEQQDLAVLKRCEWVSNNTEASSGQ